MTFCAESEFDDSTVQKAFPNLPESELPAFPMWMEMTPDGKYWWIAGIQGKLIQVQHMHHAEREEL